MLPVRIDPAQLAAILDTVRTFTVELRRLNDNLDGRRAPVASVAPTTREPA